MKNILLLLLLFPSLLFAQKISIQLIDETSKQAIEGTTVFTSKGYATQSDKDGFFTVKMSQGDTLFFTRIGYRNAQFIFNDAQPITVLYLKPSTPSLSDVVVNAKLGTALLSNVHRIDLTTRPFNNSQEILRIVPGLFIGQHAGGGKAEQLFLRGFDIDHGTDVSITADGMPVNMVSHAHGQGYADLHFVIPETVDKMDFGKGTYYADKGDFATAGYVALSTFNYLPKNMFRIEGGMFNTLRTVGMMNLFKPQQKQNAYIAGELYITDGPFDAAQQFKRYNLFAKHQYHFAASTLTTQVSTFWSRWYASGQVPVRAIEDGAIDWFGAIDPNEGGQTSRTNVSFKLNTRLHNGGVVENQLFYTKYNFELYSNFTFFKEDPINGDEIRQKENRNILGFNSTYSKDKYLNAGKSWQFKGGFNIRHDINEGLELSRTLRRTTVTQPLAYGDVVETSISGFLSETYRSKKWTLNAALRYDQFNFQYEDQLNRLPNKSVNKGIFCPKFNVQYQATSQTALYVKAGRGFHSNDARVVIPQNGAKVLPGAWGADIGFIAKPVPKLMLNAAIWVLDLAQEFVYVGDEAVVEPGSRTFRKGIDLSLRYELTKHLLVDIDANYTIGRAIEEPKGMQYLPLAPKFSSTGGLAYTGTKINAGLRYRWLGNRAANEDNSILAKGYCILDANFTYRINKKYSVGFVAENLLNTKWKETQFLTESRLQNEIVPVEEIHFTPGTPFFIKARFTVEF